jgi:hypothetical protein
MSVPTRNDWGENEGKDEKVSREDRFVRAAVAIRVSDGQLRLPDSTYATKD